MQASSQNKVRETKDFASKISNIIGKLEFVTEDEKDFSLSSYIYYLLKAAENSDPKLRAEIENNIVKLGLKAVPSLIDTIMAIKGPARGLAAMAIIRIGAASIEMLEDTAVLVPDFAWIADYIIGEISGTQIPVQVYSEKNIQIAG